MNFKKYFKTLRDWKKLPAYSLEPRIDSIIGYYLDELILYYIIKKKKNKIIGIIPEFPIRKKTIFNTSSGEDSRKIDFLAISKDGPHYLVEIKTDSKSRRKDQDDYYIKAKEKKLGALINGIKDIYKKTNYEKKYEHLFDKLEEYKLINAHHELNRINDDLEIIYIQPSNNKEENNVIDFKQISDFINSRKNIDNFERELSKTLLKWLND